VPMGEGYTRIEFEIPARGLIGFRGMFLTDTKGEGVMNHSFLEFRPYSGTVESRQYGALISMESGTAMAYSLFNLQDRGVLFIDPQDKVYEGMIIGEHSRSNDLTVNPIKGKAQSNVRSSGADEAISAGVDRRRRTSRSHAAERAHPQALPERKRAQTQRARQKISLFPAFSAPSGLSPSFIPSALFFLCF
jgi:predicted membrane GTPase involved in stress response